MRQIKINKIKTKHINLIDLLGYKDFIEYQKKSLFIISDLRYSTRRASII